ncbi:hypothetical protein [Roseobacter sp.]|uniref:hypothetical protein n=1 Tax=Roseobacter sp. TaxID=1907202 RepID=UPI0032971B94
MTVQDKLDEFRIRFSGCIIVAYADVSSRVVFAASTRDTIPRENLDKVASQAADHLTGVAAQQLKNVMFRETCGPAAALSFEGNGISCALRASTSSQEVLCLLCDLGTSMGEVMSAGQVLLSDLSGEG